MPTPPEPSALPGEPTRGQAAALFVASFCAVAVLFLLATVLQLINLPFGLMATSLFVFAAAGLSFPRAFNLAPATFTGLRRLPLGLVALGLALGLANLGLADFMMGALRELLPHGWSKMADQTTIILVNAHRSARIVIVLAAGVAAPIGEELFFRGWLQGVLARRYSMATSIFWTAVVFSVTHMDRVGFIPRVELGILFGLLRATSGSLYPSMAAHAAHNLVSTALLYFSADPLAELSQPFDWKQSALVGGGSLVATLAVLWLLVRFAPRARAKEPEPLLARRPNRPTFSFDLAAAFRGALLVFALLVGSGVALQHFEHALPGYGLVTNPIDEWRSRAKPPLPPANPAKP